MFVVLVLTECVVCVPCINQQCGIVTSTQARHAQVMRLVQWF